MEADKERNFYIIPAWTRGFDGRTFPESKASRFYLAGAYRAGARICVRYVSYQNTSKLTADTARAYLAWLDAGNYGTHYEMERTTA